MQAMACGAFAEKVVVDKSQIVKVSSKISYEAAALMACGVITGIGAVVNAAKIKPGQDVIIIGAGGVGLNAIQGARLAGARRIIAVDLSEEKLNIAIEFGATDGILGTKGSPWKLAKEKLGRGADAVFVCMCRLSPLPLFVAAVCLLDVSILFFVRPRICFSTTFWGARRCLLRLRRLPPDESGSIEFYNGFWRGRPLKGPVAPGARGPQTCLEPTV